jgi:sigma-B regulation protein RsbU (phosphoserine phosphatase)
MTDDGQARDAFEEAACGLLLLDAKGRIEIANRLMGVWAGTTSEALIGRAFQDLLTVGSKLFLQTQWWPLIEMQGSVAEVQLELAQKGAHAPVLVNAIRRADRRTDVAVFLASDRKKYERELLLARRRAEELVETLALREAELREAERAAQQRATFAEQLMGIVSHDLRNPLNAIVMGTELLAMSNERIDREKTTKRIASAAQRATRLTRDLLDFTQARVGGGLPVVKREADLHHLVGDTVEELRLGWSGRSIEHVREGSGNASVDPDRVSQVVTNLVGNAMVYGAKDQPIRVTSFVIDGVAGVRVHNFGPPVPLELRERIFEPLQRGADQLRGGSTSIGLGLYIVREIARAHGGEARLESSAEAGTTFEVVLTPRKT